jgi:hypothetical protein
METVTSPAEQRVVLQYLRTSARRPREQQRAASYLRPGRAGDHEPVTRAREVQSTHSTTRVGRGRGAKHRSRRSRLHDLQARRPERGFEPDSCFYIQNEEQVRGKDRIDLAVDPPPDLVIEIDITSPSFSKLPIYAQIGVPEVWRYDGERMTILVLEGSDYAERTESIVLPPVTSNVLTDFVEKSKSMKRTAWLEVVREWARENTGSSS